MIRKSPVIAVLIGAKSHVFQDCLPYRSSISQGTLIDPLLLPLIISDNLHSDCPLLRKKLDLKQKNIFYVPIKLLPKHLQLIESNTQGLVRTVMSSCLSRSHFLIMVSREPENSSCPLMAKDWIPS